MKKIINEIFDVIRENNSFVISSHVNPDGDALGSELGLARALKKINKQVRIINSSETPRELKFLDRNNEIEKYLPRKHNKIIAESDVHFFLDLNQLYRTGKMEKTFDKHRKFRICIDHHQSPDEFADLYFIEPSFSSVGEMIFNLINKTKMTEFDFGIAEPIYVAIMTDTGSFKYERTTPKTHRVAAKLMKYGIDPKQTYAQIYERYTFSRMKILGKALQTLELHAEGKIATMFVTKKDIEKYNGSLSDIEGFVNNTLLIDGVKIGLLFYEIGDGFKISYRSRGNIPMNKLASEFGGGGHINAAGSLIENAKISKWKKKVVAKATEYLKYDN